MALPGLDCPEAWRSFPSMKASEGTEDNPLQERSAAGPALPGAEPAPLLKAADEMDLSLLEDSLAKSPWERMLANDDAVNFADLLRAAMEKRDAKP